MQLESLQLSNSSLNMFHSCPRKLEFRKFYKHSLREESQAMSAGTALHIGYQTFLETGNKELAIFAFMLAYPIKYQTSPGAKRSLEACFATLLAMFKFDELGRYEIATIKTEEGIKHAIEVPFRINVKNFSLSDTENIPVYYVGYIDLVLYDKLEDVYIVCDIKTTTVNMADMSPVYKFDPQCLPYAMVLERLLGLPLDSLDMKYMPCYIHLEEPKIRLYSFPKTRADIEDWVQGLYDDLHQIKNYYTAMWFPRRGNNCMAWNRPCQFFEFCNTRRPDAIEAQLDFAKAREGEDKPIVPWIEMDLEIAA
jgi:hypothetical protein